VAAGDVQQDEKINTAGRMPAILKYNFLNVKLGGQRPQLLKQSEHRTLNTKLPTSNGVQKTEDLSSKILKWIFDLRA
jgi:hypothetical protein